MDSLVRRVDTDPNGRIMVKARLVHETAAMHTVEGKFWSPLKPLKVGPKSISQR